MASGSSAGARWGIVFAIACSGDSNGTPSDSASDTAAAATLPTATGYGNVVIEMNSASAVADSDTRVLGVFTDPPTDVRNLAQCLGGQQFCLRADRPMDINASVDVDTFDPKLLESISTLSAGSELSLGTWTAPFFFDSATKLAFYSQVTPGIQTASVPIDLVIEGDVWPGTVAKAVIELPDPVGLRLLDPMVVQDFVDADGIPLRWLPGEAPPLDPFAGKEGQVGVVGAPGEVFLYVETPTRRRLQRLDDTGSYDLDLSGANLSDGDVVDLMLGRWTRGEVDQAGRTTVVTVQRNQRIRGIWRSIGVRRPITVRESCTDAQKAPGVDDGFYEGRFAPKVNDLDPGSVGCTGRAAAGVDGLIPVDVRPQQELQVRFQLPDADASLYLLTDCSDTASCLLGSDAVGPETVTWVNETGDLTRVFIVMDAVGPATGDFTLDIRRRALGGDVFVNSCIEAIEQGPIGPGFFEGSLLDHANLLPVYPKDGPCAGERLGGEGIVAVELNGGATLDVNAVGSSGNIGLHVLSNCSIAASCVAFGEKTLSYTNPTPFTRTVYLVLDDELGIDQYRLGVSF